MMSVKKFLISLYNVLAIRSVMAIFNHDDLNSKPNVHIPMKIIIIEP